MRRPRFFYGYIIVAAATLTLTLTNGAMYSFGVFLKPLAGEFGWNRAMTSGAYSLFLFILALLYLATGRLTDRLGPRVVGTVCGVFLGLGYFLMSQVNTLWQLYLLYGVVVALGMSGGLVPLMSMTARWFIKRRGIMTGIVVSGAGLGTVIIPPVASWLIAVYSWRTSYTIVGVIVLALVIAVAQLLRRDPGKMDLLAYGEDARDGGRRKASSTQTAGSSLREARQTRQFWTLAAICFCFGISLQSMMVHIVPHATDLGVPALTAANILATIGGTSIVGRLGIGLTADRIGSKTCLAIGFVLLTTALFLLQIVRELWAFYLFATIYGMSIGGLVALESPTVAELFGLKEHGAILGIMVSTSIIAGAIGALALGRIFDVTGSYSAAFWGLTALSITGLALSLVLKHLPSLRHGNI
ncbi:MAG: MFS transporter [Chloroflexi bacterium]|nr:MFS transporter [Chloroflexota bacterium]